MLLIEVLNSLQNSAGEIVCPATTFGGQSHTLCPGSTFTAIAAAYGTQGIWALSDIVDQLMFTPLAALGPLLYVIAAASGLISLALGAPPKMYLWFFLGPAVYRWLIGTQVPAIGMSWKVAGVEEDMREVWRKAEVGLVNSAIGIKGVRDPRSGARSGPNSIQFYNDAAPSDYVWVPYFFALYDNLVSGTIQGLIQITGVYSQRTSASPDQARSSLPSAGLMGGTLPANNDNKWFLLSNSKWSMIENITGGKAHNPNLRTALTQFMSNTCGDRFANALDSGRFVSALYGKTRTSPGSVFKKDMSGTTVTDPSGGDVLWGGTPGADILDNETYNQLYKALSTEIVPMPRSIKNLLKDASTGSFRHSINFGNGMVSPTGDPGQDFWRLSQTEDIRCSNYLNIIIAAFRWEAGQIFHQFMSNTPSSLTRRNIAYNLLYGWDIRRVPQGGGAATHLNSDEQEEFIQNLILVHLIRNELALTPPKINRVQLNSDMTDASATGHLRYVATKNKFSELYQWALMIPNMQGILLYFLAIGYPFACLLLIMPGLHKTLISWMSFWAWVKLWDLGFAMVMALERSVWAILGSNSSMVKSFGFIANMQNWGYVNVLECPSTSVGCSLVRVTLHHRDGNAEPYLKLSEAAHWISQMRIFDRAISVGASLDLDLQNSYYIYIMAGLYFAVPVVTGQLVLGAKSGMTSLVNNVIGGVGQEAGRQAAAGYSGDLQTRIKSNFATGSQAAAQASLQSGAAGKLMAHALDSGNQNVALQAGAGQLRRSQAGIETGRELAVLNAQAYDKAVNTGIGGTADAVDSLAGGTTGSGAGGAGGGRRNGVSRTVGALKGGLAATSAKVYQDAYDADAAGKVKGFEVGNTEWEMQQQGSGYNLAGDRARVQGGYEAESAVWDYRNSFAQALSATATSLGGLPGGVEPGSMPMDPMAMALNGEGGARLKALGEFSNPWAPKDANGVPMAPYQQYVSGGRQQLQAVESSLASQKDSVAFNFATGEEKLKAWGANPNIQRPENAAANLYSNSESLK